MKILLLAAVPLLWATEPLGAAEPENDAGTTVVPYADLDLGRAQDRAVLDRRLRGASRFLCRTTPARGPLAWISESGCRRATVAQARRTAALAAAVAERRARLARNRRMQ